MPELLPALTQLLLQQVMLPLPPLEMLLPLPPQLMALQPLQQKMLRKMKKNPNGGNSGIGSNLRRVKRLQLHNQVLQQSPLPLPVLMLPLPALMLPRPLQPPVMLQPQLLHLLMRKC